MKRALSLFSFVDKALPVLILRLITDLCSLFFLYGLPSFFLTGSSSRIRYRGSVFGLWWSALLLIFPQRATVLDPWTPFDFRILLLVYDYSLRYSLRCLYRPMGLTPFCKNQNWLCCLAYRFPILPYLTLDLPKPFPTFMIFGHLNRSPYLSIHRLPKINFLYLMFSLGIQFFRSACAFESFLWTHAFHFLFLVLSFC